MARVVVYHSTYGCATGCCGHTVELQTDDGKEDKRFEFDHPWVKFGEEDGMKEWARDLVRVTFGEEHVADLDWDNSILVDD